MSRSTERMSTSHAAPPLPPHLSLAVELPVDDWAQLIGVFFGLAWSGPPDRWLDQLVSRLYSAYSRALGVPLEAALNLSLLPDELRARMVDHG